MPSPTYMAPVAASTHQDVAFRSEGLRLAGHLYRPPGLAPDVKTPAIVMAGPMTSVKEETLPHYAVPLAEAGFTVLTFDNRNFGASEGEPRQHLDTGEQVEDLKNAISYMLTRPDILPERLGLCCVCLGAGYGLEVAAFDRRIKALALVAGGYNSADTFLDFMGPAGFAGYLDMLNTKRQVEYESGEVQYLPAVAGPPQFGPAAMPVQEAFEYYTHARETQAPNWQNRLTYRSMESLAAWNVVDHAHLIAPRPLLVVHGTQDFLLPPRYAREVFERAGEPKELLWIETDNHVQLYDQVPYVPKALAKVVPWLVEHLR